MARTKTTYDHFIICPSSVTLTFNLQPTQANVSYSTTTLQGEHLYKTILKSMH